ncbi:hypothetical protein THF1D04_40383 [Vibrio owensii]|uniref:Uncharacterized protein n=1 Tax=Vibrio owensii TaxID=696485 RepID=A0AAU9Q9N8_9VIBR|nr:hypothetical protein THF1D04_40383 [Vibrio owensii]
MVKKSATNGDATLQESRTLRSERKKMENCVSGFGIRDSGFGIREHDAPRGALKLKLENKCTAILTTHFISLIYVNLKANCPHTGNYQRAPLEAKHSKSARAHQTKREPR